MTKYARIENGVVVEIINAEQQLTELYHPDVSASFVKASQNVECGWAYSTSGFSKPTPVVQTAEQLRAVMPTLTPRQFWLAALRINITKADVLALVDAMEDKQAAADMRIEITETVSFQRTNPAVDQLATLLNIPPEQLDSLWTWAADF